MYAHSDPSSFRDHVDVVVRRKDKSLITVTGSGINITEIPNPSTSNSPWDIETETLMLSSMHNLNCEAGKGRGSPKRCRQIVEVKSFQRFGTGGP